MNSDDLERPWSNASIMITEAKLLALSAHDGQTRRDGITPYIQHVEKVVQNVINRKGSDIMIVVAFLHDVAEDGGEQYAIDYIRSCFGELIADAVDALTHRKGESYMESIARAKANPIARQVKIADNLANLSDTPTDRQIIKYAESLQFLMND